MNNTLPGCLLTAILVCNQPLFADRVFNILIENDVFSNTDHHYTSGVMFNYVSGIDEGPRRLQDMGIRFPGIEAGDAMHVSVFVGHEIYTPTDIVENPDEIETWRLSLRLVGPGARAEVMQNNLHRAIGSDEARGWDRQLKNEVMASVVYERKWLHLARSKTFNNLLEFDMIPQASASLGTA